MPGNEPLDSRLTIETLHSADGETMTLTLHGELDVITANVLCSTTIAHMKEGVRHLRLDLTRVVRCDEGSLYMILGFRQALHVTAGDLSVVATSESVQRTVGLNKTLHRLLEP